jgi:DNA-binding IclR family transcriptional regulator
MAKTSGLRERGGAPDIPASQRVEAVERALAILEAFDATTTAQSLADLARSTGLHKSTLLRLAGSLIYCGFLTRAADGMYRLGPEIARLGALNPASGDPGAVIRPVLDMLVARTGETASFYVREGEERVCRYRRNSPHAARHHLDEGARLPLAQGAAGRVLMAFSDASAGDSARRRHFQVSIGERDPAVAAVAVPVFDRRGGLIGALTISGIRSRFDEAARASAAELLTEASSTLSARLAD